MAAQTSTALHQLLGLVLWGDIGPLTMYRSREGRLVIFKKTWPDKPATPRQIACRDAMVTCGRAWRGMPPHQRALWHQVARKCSLKGHGYSLWVHWRFKQPVAALRTLQQQAGIELYTAAQTQHVYDPRWRDRPWRVGPTYEDPELYVFPFLPWVDWRWPCTIWYMPFTSQVPYWSPLTITVDLDGPGSITQWQAYNRAYIPITYTPAGPGTIADLTITAYWPDGSYTVRPVFLLMT